ncbi:MAG: hypothetical protein SFW09_10495 [Hyphomicrobiaceae bacterium]|nr:hypothetical protein [Hyphomicrobiaceae bacterium]
MAHVIFDRVTPSPGFSSLPLRLDQRSSRGSALSRLLLFLPAALALSVPLTIVAARAIAEPQTLALLAERPVASLQIALGVLLWLSLFVLPARLALVRLWASRQVEIAEGAVHVVDRVGLEPRAWSAPIASYLGLAHHIRASLSGVTHEIVLVHPDARRDVTLMVADKVTQRTLDEAKALLGLPEVSPRTMYERPSTRSFEFPVTGAWRPAGA